MKNWTIRRAERSDAVALAECIDEAYSIYAHRITDLPAVSEGMEDEIENNLVWVAVVDSQIVGGMVLVPKRDYAVLTNVAVSPNSVGGGLGRAFMNIAETETLRLGLEKLQLSTHSGMPENVRLYKHLGWNEIGRSGNKVNMEKSLIP